MEYADGSSAFLTVSDSLLHGPAVFKDVAGITEEVALFHSGQKTGLVFYQTIDPWTVYVGQVRTI